jgi:hypothetical protein
VQKYFYTHSLNVIISKIRDYKLSKGNFMKNTIKIVGIVLITAVVIFTIAACNKTPPPAPVPAPAPVVEPPPPPPPPAPEPAVVAPANPPSAPAVVPAVIEEPEPAKKQQIVPAEPAPAASTGKKQSIVD